MLGAAGRRPQRRELKLQPQPTAALSHFETWPRRTFHIWQVLLNFQTTDNTDIDCSGSDRISPRQNNKVAQLSSAQCEDQQTVADRDKTITNIIFSDLAMI